MTGSSFANPEVLVLEYWDAFLSGKPTLPEVDPRLRDTIAWLTEHDDADGPTPEFVARTRAQFAGEVPEQTQLIEWREASVRPAKPSPVVGERPWWRNPAWPIAAALCLALGLAYLFGGGSITDRLADRWNDDPTAPAAVVPAPSAVPASPVPDASPTAEVDDSQNAATSVPMYLNNPARTGNPNATGPAGELEVLWSADTGGAAARSPVMADGVIFAGSVNGKFTAVDAASGAVLWTFNGGGPIRTTALIADDLVITAAGQASSNGYVYGVEKATGKERWRFPVGDQVLSDPLLYDGLLIFGSDDGFVYALNPATGEQKWSYDAGSPVSAAAAAESGTVVFGAAKGIFTALDAATGSQLWTFTPPEVETVTDADPFAGHLWSTPVVLDGHIFVVYTRSTQALIGPVFVFSLNLDSGVVAWQRDDLVTEMALLMPADGENLHALSYRANELLLTTFSREDGTRVRESLPLPATNNISATGGAIAGDRLYLVSGGSSVEGSSKLLAFSLDDGSLVAEVPLPGAGNTSERGSKQTPVIVSKRIFLGMNNGSIVSIGSLHDDSTPVAGTDETSGSDVTMFRANPARLGDPNTVGPQALPDVAWSFVTGSRIRSSPVLSDGVIFIGTTIGQMYAFDASNGDIVWQVDTDGRIQSTPLIVGDLVIVAAADTARPGFVLAYDRATGVEAWRYPVGDQVSSDPLLYEGVVYLGSDDGYVYALNPGDGTEVWKVDTGAPVAWPTAADAGLLVVGNRDGTLFALDAAIGTERWRLEPDLVSLGQDPNNIADHTWSMPLIADGRVIVAYRPITMQFTGSIVVAYALNLQSGEIEWVRTDLLSGGQQLLHWDNGVVRAVIQGITLAASLISFDPTTGEEIGEPVDLIRSQGTTLTEGVIVNDRLYMYMGSPTSTSTAPASLNVYELPSVKLIGRVDLTGAGPAGEMGDGRPPIVAGGSVYLGTSDGVVFALRAADDAAETSSGSTAMYLSNPARTGDPDAIGPLDAPEIRWTSDLGGSIEAAPVVVDGLVYAGASDGTIAALDDVDGSIVWEFPAAYPIRLSLVVSDQYVYAAGGDLGLLVRCFVSTG